MVSLGAGGDVIDIGLHGNPPCDASRCRRIQFVNRNNDAAPIVGTPTWGTQPLITVVLCFVLSNSKQTAMISP